MARVSTYLNFPRNTEEAFLFYKSVFGGEFSGGGIARFSDVPPMEGMPPLPEADKSLIMHIELPILGGHILMGTDAPESMGFTVNFGNNVHINLEPDTREESKKLYDALSAGGTITMELQDVFWGAYYGSCTDKFGVQWMFNCVEKSKTMETTDKTAITVETIVKAPVEKVWKCWTAPEHITQWTHASDDWHAPYAENDLRVDGKLKTTMAAKDGSVSFDFEGVYTNIREHQLIEYDIVDGRKVTVTFVRQGNETKVIETFEAESVNSPELQRGGWQAILDNFKKYTEAN